MKDNGRLIALSPSVEPVPVSPLRASIADAAAYDKFGRPFMIGDVVKIYHFTAAQRRKRHYMYKHVTGEWVWPSGFRCLFFSHLTTKPDEGFYVALDGLSHPDYEIVQGCDYDFTDRPAQATKAPPPSQDDSAVHAPNEGMGHE